MTQAVNDAIQGRGILSQNLIRQAQMLRGELREKNVKGRYRMVTENAIMKARNFSQVLSYEELKITEYQIVAIVDNKTSNICRALNGQVFETKEAISYVKEVFSTPVYEVADRFPWDNPSRWPKDPETVTPKDIRKLYEGMATKLPPYHGHCRTTVVSKTIHDTIQNNTTGKEVQKAVNEALDSINSVHRLSDSVNTIGIEETNQPKENFLGRLLYNSKTMEPVKILMNTGLDVKQYELTLAHEIGHLLDLQMLGDNPKEFASIADKKLQALREAAAKTDAISMLWKIKREKKLPNGKELHSEEYKRVIELLNEREISSRAYAQWIANKSGNINMQKQVKEIRENKNILKSLTQWDYKDFRGIEKALDELFKEEDWLK
ncbi:MAG: minor capsid protein [Leptospiraceae bacterium]|nr:minor capsid protein [Leptospiraceae bacterium]